MKTVNRLPIIFACASLPGTATCGQTATRPTATPEATDTLAPTIQPGNSTRTLTVGDLERDYLLHIPPGLDSQQPVPVVFAFHGSEEGADVIQGMSGFNDIADINGFIVVYPNGFRGDWNQGVPGLETYIDDFGFVRHMLADRGTIVRVDPKRIYATGFSAGANFSYRLACEMSDTFAAIAPVEGWMFNYPCQPQQPVSVIHVHGSKDAYEGQTSRLMASGVTAEVVFPPVEQTIATWAQLDGCSGVAQGEKQGLVTHKKYAACQNGAAVELYVIEGGGHAWPSPYVFPTINSQIIWDFFKAHPKP